MSSDVEIVNFALGKLGQNPITALNEDSVAARAVTQCYDIVRDTELAAHNWTFAIARRLLAPLNETPPFGYKFAYELPEDLQQVIVALFGGASTGGLDIYPGPNFDNYRNGPAADYAVEGQTILTNAPSPLKLVYIRKNIPADEWPPTFVAAFAAKLAIELCERLTQSNTKKQALAQEYGMAISQAVRNDNIQRPPQPIPDDTWILSRV